MSPHVLADSPAASSDKPIVPSRATTVDDSGVTRGVACLAIADTTAEVTPVLKGLLRLLARPVTWPIAALYRWLVGRRLGRVGVLEWVAGEDAHPLVTLRQLDRAMDHPRVRGLLLHVRAPAWGWAALAEWREALVRWWTAASSSS